MVLNALNSISGEREKRKKLIKKHRCGRNLCGLNVIMLTKSFITLCNCIPDPTGSGFVFWTKSWLAIDSLLCPTYIIGGIWETITLVEAEVINTSPGEEEFRLAGDYERHTAPTFSIRYQSMTI